MNFHVAQADALGAVPAEGGTRFSVRSTTAKRIWVCLFDEKGEAETKRVELLPERSDLFAAFVPGIGEGARYGLRADGDYRPERGLWFDPDKLLSDPYAIELDRPYRYDPALGARRGEGEDTAPLMPKGIVKALPRPAKLAAPLFGPGRMIYEVPVRGFSMLRKDIPEAKRGTVAALAEPAVIEHLKKIGVGAVELMPVTPTMDERHLGPLGLSNAWGYNPVNFMAVDPHLAPGGLEELRRTVAALHEAGISVILDLVFNHTAESDDRGPTVSLRGLDASAYYRRALDGRMVNDAGTGNTVDCDQPITQALVVDSLRHFVLHAGVDGFRFDLAPILGRTSHGFDPAAPLLQAIRADPVLGGRVLLAEPWDVGPGGYQLSHFGKPFLEWNDRYRDDVRRFWRGDRGMAGPMASRLAGSFDVFPGSAETRTLNFIAAHDGMTLADLVAFERKHNEANGEQNRDGHNENFSWNNGIEGPTDNPTVRDCRARDVRALLATLFASRGAIMLTAGDEWGRTQHGNNNAYAQDNAEFWLDWDNRDASLEAYVGVLAGLRANFPAFAETTELKGGQGEDNVKDVEWMSARGLPLGSAEWQEPDRKRFVMLLGSSRRRLAVCFNADRQPVLFNLPKRAGWRWSVAAEMFSGEIRMEQAGPLIPGRSVIFCEEKPG